MYILFVYLASKELLLPFSIEMAYLQFLCNDHSEQHPKMAHRT